MTDMRLQAAIARRLEEARAEKGFGSLLGFATALGERSKKTFSYTAIRNYHDHKGPARARRMATVEYLEAVSKAFGIDLAWLIRGQGTMSGGGEALPELLAEICGRHPGLDTWPYPAQQAFLELWQTYAYEIPRGDSESLREVEEDLITLLTLPLGAWGFRSLEELGPYDSLAYFNAAFSALFIAFRQVERDEPATYPNSPLPRVRRLLSGEAPDADEKTIRRFEEVQRQLEEARSAPVQYMPVQSSPEDQKKEN